MPMHLRLFPLATAALLGACAAPQSEYPSLAIRDVERVSGTMQVAPAPSPAPPPAFALSQLDGLAEQLRTSQAEFVALTPASRGVVLGAAGQARDSQDWSNAQVAIAELEALRSRTMIAVADLDRLYVDATTGGFDTAAIANVRDRAQAIIEHQTDVIVTLQGVLGA
jgi:hypothetical protein